MKTYRTTNEMSTCYTIKHMQLKLANTEHSACITKYQEKT